MSQFGIVLLGQKSEKAANNSISNPHLHRFFRFAVGNRNTINVPPHAAMHKHFSL